MHTFIAHNREELIARCKAKVAQRPRRAASEAQLRNGVPLFLEQLRKTLVAEEENETGESIRISGGTGGGISPPLTEMGVTAAAHGKQMLELGFTVDQVVHDYGDLCQSITDLAVERDAPFSISEFRTLNRCLDNAIADAVNEFSSERDALIARERSAAVNERLGFLVHELRNSVGTATLAVNALETGNLPISGATGSVLKRSLAALAILIDRSIAEVQLNHATPLELEVLSVASLVADARSGATLAADLTGCTFAVGTVAPQLEVRGNRELLLAALANLLQNAFKFTHVHTEVTMNAYAAGDRVLIDVKDHCGGLAPGHAEKMFTPFSRRNSDKTGLGLGLSIARQGVEANGGTLSVLDVPETGCVFTISLPLHGLL